VILDYFVATLIYFKIPARSLSLELSLYFCGMYNPSLREEPLGQKPTPALTGPQPSMLDWLESSGRLLAREINDREVLTRDEEMEEINELIIGEEDNDYEDDDDMEPDE
jgi:hypothetical protein